MLVKAVPPQTRAMLAVYCLHRENLSLIDLAIAASCERQATMLKTTPAERIFKSAAQGERDRERLLDAALMEFTVEKA